MLTRRSILAALAPACGFHGAILRAGFAGPAKRVAVVFPSALEPCAEALEGLRTRLAGNPVELDLLDVNKTGFDADAARELARNPAVIVAVGAEAVEAVLERKSSAKTVSTMTLQGDRAAASQTGRLTAAVYLDIPIHMLLAELRRLFPDKSRVGLISNPRRGGERTQLRSQAAQPLDLQIAECATAEELLPVFLAFRRKVDFVVCLPDGSLYNSATARPLIMASLENRLPIVGFSPAFLRAGAAVAIYPDYRSIGSQTGDVVCRCLEERDCSCWEMPRRVNVAVNARVLRMLGIEVRANANPELVILR